MKPHHKWILTVALIFLCLATLVALTEAKKNKKDSSSSTTSSTSSTDIKTKKKDESPTRESRAAERAKQMELSAKRLAKREERAISRLKKAKTANEKKAKNRKERWNKVKEYIQNERKKVDAAVKAKVSSEKPETRRKGEEKLKWFQQQSGKKSTRIIDVDPDHFKKYLNAGPRPFWTFVTLTALGSQYNCHLCQSAQSAVVKLAQTYHQHRKDVLSVLANETSITNTSLTIDMLDAPPVFFVNVDVDKNRPIFDALGLQSAPTILLLPPLTSDKNPKLSSFLSGTPSKYKYAIQRPEFSADDFESFISKHTGISVKSKGLAALDSNILIKVIIGIFAIISLLTFLVYHHWDRFHPFIYGQQYRHISIHDTIQTGYGRALLQHMIPWKISRRKIVIAIAAWGLYGFCVSGGMYNIIRSTQWEGRNEWISGDSHDQFGIESIIIASIYLLCALGTVISVLRAHVTMDLENRYEETSSSTLKKILGALFLPFQFVTTYLLIPICIVGVTYTWYQLVVIYTRKNWSYHYGWVIGHPRWW